VTVLIKVASGYITIGDKFDTRKKYLREQSAPATRYALPAGPTMAATVQTTGMSDGAGAFTTPQINWRYTCGGYTLAKTEAVGSGTGAVVGVVAPAVTNSTVLVDT
jgi:roadblock/LC7 domain-containing protein